MLESVRDLRKEREKLKELQNQKSEQRTAISHGDQRIARLENQLKEMRQVVTFDQIYLIFYFSMRSFLGQVGFAGGYP